MSDAPERIWLDSGDAEQAVILSAPTTPEDVEYIRLDLHQQEVKRLKAELAKFQKSEFHPDWSLLEASQNSIREHQQIMGRWRDGIQRLAESMTEQESTAAMTDLLEMTGLLVDD